MDVKNVGNERRSDLAADSSNITKAREKLRKQLEKESSQATPEALKKSLDTIKNYVLRNSDERISLKNRHVKVENSAVIKKQYAKLANQSKTEYPSSPSLSGRISNN